MCLVFLSVRNHPQYKLIVAGNRDEFYNRRTASAGYWDDAPQILGGRDLEAGGTWLSMNMSGKIGIVTNYRDPQNIDPRAPSRGHLITDYLRGNDSPGEYLKKLSANGVQYNGFNLIVATPEEVWYYSNYGEGIRMLTPGLFGLSNHLLETPWPKVVRGKERLKVLLDRPDIKPESIFEMLYDDVVAPDDLLPGTGLPLNRERALSSMFIKSEGYGSRCSTVVLIDQNNRVTFAERVFDVETFEHKTQTFEFLLES
jgi:uncharacterized protein with NRDE domain